MRPFQHLFLVSLCACVVVSGCGQARPRRARGSADTQKADFSDTQTPGEATKEEPPKVPSPLKGKSVAEWVALLKDASPEARREAATTLSTVDEESKPTLVPLLLETLKNDQADIRQLSAYVLGNVCLPSEQVLAGLATALQDKEPTVRRSAATALVRVGRHDPDKLGALLKAALKHETADVRSLAAYVRENVEGKTVSQVARHDKTVESTREDDTKAAASTNREVGLEIGQLAPEIVGRDIDGWSPKLSDQRGKVVCLYFWGHWCGYCRRMYPQVKNLVNMNGAKPFALIGVNCGDSEGLLKGLKAKGELTWKVWTDKDSAISDAWGIDAIPTLYVLDHRGVIRYRFWGTPEAGKLEKAIEKLLSEVR